MSNKKRRSCLAAFASFLLSIILTAALIAAIPITLLNLFLTDHNIDVLVDHTISSIELDKIEFSTEEGDKTVADVILDITDEVEGLNYITEEQINDVLLNDFVKGFVSDTLKQYGMSINSLGWTPERIYGFIEGNQETIEQLAREAGYEGELPVIEEKKEIIIENIEQKIGEDGISATALLGDSGEAEEFTRYLETAQKLFSQDALFFVWGITAFVALLIFFVNLGYFGSFCRACGFPAFLIGGIFFLAGLGISPLLSVLDIQMPIIASAVEFAAGFVGALLMDISVIVLGVGLALIIFSFISDAIARRREN